MNQRDRNGVNFTECHVCHTPIGNRGLARHLQGHEGTVPAPRTAAKLPTLDRAALAVLAEAAEGTSTAKREAYKTTVKRLGRLGYLAADLAITTEGRARIA